MIVNGDLLNVTSGLIVHQVNCRGAMGRGLALALRQKYPRVYSCYMTSHKLGQWQLGKIQVIRVDTNLWVCNFAGQFNLGTHTRMTDYDAYHVGFPKIAKYAAERDLAVSAPYFLGCGLAGGDWNVIQPLVESYLPNITWVKSSTHWQKLEDMIPLGN